MGGKEVYRACCEVAIALYQWPRLGQGVSGECKWNVRLWELKSSIFLSGSPELLEPYLREFTRTGLHLLPDQYHADNLTSVEIP